MSRRRKWVCTKHRRSFKTKAGLLAHRRGKSHQKVVASTWLPRPEKVVKTPRSRNPPRAPRPPRVPKPPRVRVSRVITKPACPFCEEDHGDDGHPYERDPDVVRFDRTPRTSRTWKMQPVIRAVDAREPIEHLPVREVRLTNLREGVW